MQDGNIITSKVDADIHLRAIAICKLRDVNYTVAELRELYLQAYLDAVKHMKNELIKLHDEN